jgi:hypothetical protein
MGDFYSSELNGTLASPLSDFYQHSLGGFEVAVENVLIDSSVPRSVVNPGTEELAGFTWLAASGGSQAPEEWTSVKLLHLRLEGPSITVDYRYPAEKNVWGLVDSGGGPNFMTFVSQDLFDSFPSNMSGAGVCPSYFSGSGSNCRCAPNGTTVTWDLTGRRPSGSATGGEGGKRCLWQNRACRVERLLGIKGLHVSYRRPGLSVRSDLPSERRVLLRGHLT